MTLMLTGRVRSELDFVLPHLELGWWRLQYHQQSLNFNIKPAGVEIDNCPLAVFNGPGHQEVEHITLPIVHWTLSHMATPKCKGTWET